MLQPTDTIAVRVVQPNIDPYGDKFTGLSARAQINSMLRLIQNEQPEDLDLVVLPETAIPRSIQETTVANNLYVKLLSEPLAPDSISILTGMVAYRIYFPQRGDEIPPSANCNKEKAYCYDNWNAATMLNTGAKPRIYQKAKLVPFSERTPFLEYMEFLEEFNMDLGGAFGSYALPDSLILLRTGKGVPVGPIICYESIFSSYVRRLVDRGAQLLCIVTNDGWWKQTSGYIQHASYARLRAIETRRAIARSANTGQSCFISPTGRLSHRTPWWEPAVIDDNLPLLTGRTLYVRWRDWWPKLMLGVVVGVLLLGIIRPRRELD
jgi:apolipoprotein N-acyltransferase